MINSKIKKILYETKKQWTEIYKKMIKIKLKKLKKYSNTP